MRCHAEFEQMAEEETRERFSNRFLTIIGDGGLHQPSYHPIIFCMSV